MRINWQERRREEGERKRRKMPEIDSIAVYKNLYNKDCAKIILEIKEYATALLENTEFCYSQEIKGMQSICRKILKMIDKEEEI